VLVSRGAMTEARSPLHRRYVFARPLAFDLECPTCGTVDVVRHGRPWWRTRASAFNPITHRWRCRTCRQIFAVGLALWPVSRTGNRRPKGVGRPPDTRPSLNQISVLNELRGVVRKQTRSLRDPVNLLCHCLDRDDFDPARPWHGFET
jgi:hypothetical protein